MANRQEHRQEVFSFLQKHFPGHTWRLSLPHGTGMETYFAFGDGQGYFVKVAAPVERYQALAEIGLTPPLLAAGQLESGSSVIVQPLVRGHTPSRGDFRQRLEQVAASIRTLHHDPRLRATLSPVGSECHKDAALTALHSLRKSWEAHRAVVPGVADFVDHALDHLDPQIQRFATEGLVCSHNDICNANWLFTENEEIYIVDLDSMSLDDPAFDMGALLWWYYPPELREPFLKIAGYHYDEAFKFRMRLRMTLHCLRITLPREGSFDRFDPQHYETALVDFRAILEGKENPQGYDP